MKERRGLSRRNRNMRNPRYRAATERNGSLEDLDLYCGKNSIEITNQDPVTAPTNVRTNGERSCKEAQADM
jgi:hypothetical protein